MSLSMNQTTQRERLDIIEIVHGLLQELGERERNILRKRFKLELGVTRKTTLEDIGKLYNITRERVRQIEADSIKKLRELEETHAAKKRLTVIQLAMERELRSHAGLMEEEYLLDRILSSFDIPEISENDEKMHLQREGLFFIIDQMLLHKFEKIDDNEHLHNIWKLKNVSLDFIESFLNLLVELVVRENRPLAQEEIIERVRQSVTYKDWESGFMAHVNHLRQDIVEFENVLVSYFKMSRKLKCNLFAQWGLSHWNTISPKRINDKIYLILKKSGEPLHFNEITQRINAVKFDHKTACAATVHNELILDDNYVLVGRGIYALKEWGYMPGTVSQVVFNILKEKGKLTKEQIMEEVTKRRIVKQATVNLALMDKNKFVKLPDGEYAASE